MATPARVTDGGREARTRRARSAAMLVFPTVEGAPLMSADRVILRGDRTPRVSTRSAALRSSSSCRDPAAGTQHSILRGHIGAISSLCSFTSDNRPLLATAGSDQNIWVWDAVTGIYISVLEGHAAPVNAICAFTTGDRTLLATGSDDRTVLIWDFITASAILTVPTRREVLSVCHASDLLLVGTRAGLLAIKLDSGYVNSRGLGRSRR